VLFIMNGANHSMSGLSTYPFNIFGQGWEEGFDPAAWAGTARRYGGGQRRLDRLRGHHHAGRYHRRRRGDRGEIGGVARRAALCGGGRQPGARGQAALRRRNRRAAAGDRLVELAGDRITRNLDAIRGGDVDALEEADRRWR
jgi:virginiamycin A acetyltransferase